ncbi:MAG: DUF2848 domain-containing protein [Dongiaceae bacterium]
MLLEAMCCSAEGRQLRRIGVDQLVIAGWTGRNKSAVQHHIDELAAIGVAPPASVPCFYRCSVGLLTSAPVIQVLGTESSGEVEFVLLFLEDGIWVGVGSDHTDRKVEAYSIPVSKQMCPKPLSAEFWPMAELADHWDRLELSSVIEEEGPAVTYQEGAVTAMLAPPDLIAAYRAAGGEPRPGTVMFGGTLAAQGGVRPARRFEARLDDPVRGRRLAHRYETECLPLA